MDVGLAVDGRRDIRFSGQECNNLLSLLGKRLPIAIDECEWVVEEHCSRLLDAWQSDASRFRKITFLANRGCPTEGFTINERVKRAMSVRRRTIEFGDLDDGAVIPGPFVIHSYIVDI